MAISRLESSAKIHCLIGAESALELNLDLTPGRVRRVVQNGVHGGAKIAAASIRTATAAPEVARSVYSREPGAESCSAPRSKVPRGPNPRASAQALARDCGRFCLPPVPTLQLGLCHHGGLICIRGTRRRLALQFRRGLSCITDWKTKPGREPHGWARLQPPG